MSWLDLSNRNPEATLYVGSLDEKVSEDLLWELFLQVCVFIKELFLSCCLLRLILLCKEHL
jgi:hypothetical protein